MLFKRISPFVALVLCAVVESRAGIIVTLPTATVPGSLVVTEDVEFTITSPGDVDVIVFDEWVAADAFTDTILPANIGPAIAYSLNNGPTVLANQKGLFDNLSASLYDVTANDGFWGAAIGSVLLSDVVILKAATYTLAAGSLPAHFNPAAAQTFTGEAFLTDPFGNRLSGNTSVGGAVPEPGTIGLGLLSGLAFLGRRRG